MQNIYLEQLRNLCYECQQKLEREHKLIFAEAIQAVTQGKCKQ